MDEPTQKYLEAKHQVLVEALSPHGQAIVAAAPPMGQHQLTVVSSALAATRVSRKKVA